MSASIMAPAPLTADANAMSSEAGRALRSDEGDSRPPFVGIAADTARLLAKRVTHAVRPVHRYARRRGDGFRIAPPCRQRLLPAQFEGRSPPTVSCAGYEAAQHTERGRPTWK